MRRVSALLSTGRGRRWRRVQAAETAYGYASRCTLQNDVHIRERGYCKGLSPIAKY